MFKKIFNYIYKFYRPEKQELIHENAAYFHEDLFNQVEFIPKENLAFLEKENEKITNFSEENFDENGFTNLYIRDENQKTNLLQKKINFNEFCDFLISLEMEKFEKVYYFYGATNIVSENTFAFKIVGAEIFIVEKNGFINDLFINGFRFHENKDDKIKLENILFQIGKKYNLILNDWDLCKTIDLNNQNNIKQYLNEEL